MPPGTKLWVKSPDEDVECSLPKGSVKKLGFAVRADGRAAVERTNLWVLFLGKAVEDIFMVVVPVVVVGTKVHRFVDDLLDLIKTLGLKKIHRLEDGFF